MNKGGPEHVRHEFYTCMNRSGSWRGDIRQDKKRWYGSGRVGGVAADSEVSLMRGTGLGWVQIALERVEAPRMCCGRKGNMEQAGMVGCIVWHGDGVEDIEKMGG
ncbi:hypothetical protein FIBSPDRAFT_884654 [Athelia psychrophila]|uniref:Uncharacterized protein n=1 Tax=Athelia psychrophila TaxID=1759441 RepID=A0A166SZC6_9AGAM|nr:hypothetical protein FIBSPDRAFT_884654 [Fibularhizoctonia sp. CBS 109695]